MAKNKKNQSIKDMIRNLVRGQSRAKNKVVLTADQQELDFYELEDDATPQVGDKANFDGQPAEGEFTMANGEVYVFAEGELIEIKEADSGGSAETIEEVATQVEEIQETVEEIQEAVVTLIEEIAPEIQNLRKENTRLSAIVNKLKNASSEAPKGSHERAQGTDNKNSKEKELDSAIANIKKSKFKKK